jgi:hypothetical protein
MTGDQHSDSVALDLPAFAVALIRRVLTKISLTAADKATLNILQNAFPSEHKPFFEMVSSAGQAITPGLWAFYLQLLLHDWNDQAKDSAVLLLAGRELYPSAGDSAANALLDATIQSLELLAWLGYEDGYSDADRASPEELVKRMHHLAEATEASGNADDAYDVTALALDMVAPIVRGREELARYALGLALKADKAHQVAACSQAIAASIGAAADALPARRAEAFDAFEIAIDRLRSTPQPFQSLLAQGLASEVSRRDYLRKLMIPLWFLFPEPDRPAGFKAAVGGDNWPERFSEVLGRNGFRN